VKETKSNWRFYNMEINQFDEVLGVMPTQDITEGRFVLLCAHTFSQDFGSETDLPGVKLPATAEEAKKARYILTWKVDNRATPFTVTAPSSLVWSERGGWSSTTGEGPISATVYLTPPGNQNCLVIPSGVSSLGYTDGTFTVASGCYIDSADIKVVGANIMIADTVSDGGATNAGKPKYAGNLAVGVIGETREYNSTTGALTIEVW
jgi:hypothetical protein